MDGMIGNISFAVIILVLLGLIVLYESLAECPVLWTGMNADGGGLIFVAQVFAHCQSLDLIDPFD
ncbi:MAG: hypothetical protein O7G87_02740 [bacterium]|nr:hypothetical protein [bacterium]